MKTSLIAQRDSSQLVMIDVQERLAATMPTAAMQEASKNCAALLQAADLLEIPMIYTEQYPKGLGATVPALMPLLAPATRVEKLVFSCCNEPKFCQRLQGDRPQIILTGLEAHICVLQTALQLLQMGRQVFVAEDAVLSRNPSYKMNALERLRVAGAIVSNTESIIFEWLGTAEGEVFKQISRLLR